MQVKLGDLGFGEGDNGELTEEHACSVRVRVRRSGNSVDHNNE